MRPDFSLIWGSDNAPFTPIEASDYTAGWVFRTGAPPRRVNFDYFQNLSDQRTAWLGEQMLLAVGHEWQSDVAYDEYAVVRSPVDGQLYRSLVGGNLGNEPSVSGGQWAIGVQPQSVDYLNTTRINVASAATVNLTSSAPDTRHINITGTTAITGFTVAAGRCYFVRFAGALTLTNSASLVTQSGANIITEDGDTCMIRATAANVVEVLCYTPGVPQEVGYRQTWQDVSASRSMGVTYTNTTGRPIIVQAWGSTTSTTNSFKIVADGIDVSLSAISSNNSSATVSAIIPPGITYSAVSSNVTLLKWLELRA